MGVFRRGDCSFETCDLQVDAGAEPVSIKVNSDSHGGNPRVGAGNSARSSYRNGKGKSMRSVMKHLFSEVPRVDIPRSSFDRSHGLKTTFNSGYLVPIYCDEALPGDTFNLHLTAFARMATPLHPLMDNMFMDFFFFFVPLRLIWVDFQKAMGEQENPGDSTSFIVPTMTSTAGTGYANLSIHDYMGLPTKVPGLVHSVLWHRAYNRIWNEWFRDQNLQTRANQWTGAGPDVPADYNLLRRGKRHDYFTSALPWPQKGTAISLPLGQLAPVKMATSALLTGAQNPVILAQSLTGAAPNNNVALSTGTAGVMGSANALAAASVNNLSMMNLYADLSTATAATINQLRQAFQIQRIYEKDARGGTRYTELIQAHFGVTSPDARLQRTEYLGGGSVPINITPIAQTSATSTQPTPQGNLAAMGTVAASGPGFVKSFTEHGVLLGLVNVRADLTYQQGLDRMFSRSTRFDFYWPSLAQIGEQAILNKEIYAQGTAAPGVDDNVFGYQERYAEYRYKPSRITGQFRSNDTTPLDSWHLSQKFTTLPVLNTTFISENPPVDRVVAVPTEPQFIMDCFFKLRCARPMPVYGVPGNIDRF